MRQFVSVALVFVVGTVAAIGREAPAGEGMAIQGTVRLAPGVEADLAPEDRLIVKIYHPGDGGRARRQVLDRR